MVTEEQMNEAPSYFNSMILGELSGIECWVAGGCIRDYFTGVAPVDYDIYFPNEEEFKKAKKYLLENGAEVVWESGNGMKFNYNGLVLDLVKIYSEDPAQTIERFDFTCCMFAIKDNQLFYGESSFDDLNNRKLIINRITNPLSSLKRSYKYQRKGFNISAEEAKKLYEEIKKLPFQVGQGDDFLNFSSSGESAIVQTGGSATSVNTEIGTSGDSETIGGIGGGIGGGGGSESESVKKEMDWIPYILAGTTILLAIV